MSKCAPFEDYEYNIFGHDRSWIVLTDVVSLLVCGLCLLFMAGGGVRSFLLAVALPIVVVIPIRAVKTIHTLVDPDNVEDSIFFCVCLLLEYTIHYAVSIAFISCVAYFLFLVCKNRSTVFENKMSHSVIYGVLVLESIVRAILLEHFDATLNFIPSIAHLIIQAVTTGLVLLLWFVVPCLACRRATPKDGKSHWSVAWLTLYLIIPFILHMYQLGISSVLLLPRLGVLGYEGDRAQQVLFARSVEAYLSHKFSFTPMSILCPAFFLLPPVRDVFLSKIPKRKDRVQSPDQTQPPPMTAVSQ